MKEIIIKILLIAAALSAVTYYVGSEAGLWGDAKTVRDRSTAKVDSVLVPPP
jgi:hypothetical protein